MKRKAIPGPSFHPWGVLEFTMFVLVSAFVGNMIFLLFVVALTWLRTHLHVCLVQVT